MIFKYTAMDKTGQEEIGSVEAENQEDAQAQIRQKGLFVTKISSPKLTAARAIGKRFIDRPLIASGIVTLMVGGAIVIIIALVYVIFAFVSSLPTIGHEIPLGAHEVIQTSEQPQVRMHFISEGHQYIQFSDERKNWQIVHDPDCPKEKKIGSGVAEK